MGPLGLPSLLSALGWVPLPSEVRRRGKLGSCPQPQGVWFHWFQQLSPPTLLARPRAPAWQLPGPLSFVSLTLTLPFMLCLLQTLFWFDWVSASCWVPKADTFLGPPFTLWHLSFPVLKLLVKPLPPTQALPWLIPSFCLPGLVQSLWLAWL